MEYRRLERSGLFVSTLTLGTMTFGGQGGFSKVGSTGVAGAKRQVDMCLDAGVNLFDTANISQEASPKRYSGRRSPPGVTTYSSRRSSVCPGEIAGEGGRVRVGAARHRPGVPHPRVEPAGRWPAIWQVPARQGCFGGAARGGLE